MLTVALASAAIILIIATSATLSTPSSIQIVPTEGSLTQLQTNANVGVYADSLCTQNATFVDWEALNPGDSTTKTLWVKNRGNNAMTLGLTTANWTPANAQTDITLTWNHQGRTLQPKEVIQAALTLTVSPAIDTSITDFNFNIQVTGTA